MSTAVPNPPSDPVARLASPKLPAWAEQIVDGFNSQAHTQFILSGNTHDAFPLPPDNPPALGSLSDYLQQVVIPRYQVVLTYDIGNGLRVERGSDVFGRWNEKTEVVGKAPRPSIELVTYYLRYCANLARLGQNRVRVGVILKDAQFFLGDDTRHPDTHATAFLIREWTRERLLVEHDVVSFLLTENFNELHPLLRQNPLAAHLEVPLPGEAELRDTLRGAQPRHPHALGAAEAALEDLSRQLTGISRNGLFNLLKFKEHRKEPLAAADLAPLKARWVEQECPGLIEFLPPRLNLDALHGQEALKRHLRQNVALWRQDQTELIPMGYLISGPVGTGKTFLVKCLAGEAGVPVVVLKNFRDKWYGSTEGNLEKIFRTLKALGRCYVFIDEADQTLGRRGGSGSEPEVSGRVYSMIAQEMSNRDNRGRLVWILATSRPDLVEVDLKRPGRVDLKIPLFPTTTPEEGAELLAALGRSRQLDFPAEALASIRDRIPDLLTPGEVDALLGDLKREVLIEGISPVQALERRLANYLKPVPMETLLQQVGFAVKECSRAEFIPARFRDLAG